MSQLLKLAFISMVLALSGCAANVKRVGDAGQKVALSQAAIERLALEVRGSKALAASRDWEQFRDAWRVGMAAAASAAGIQLVPVDAALAPTAAPSTLVTVKIDDYRYVTQGARAAVGVATGNAYIDAEVSFDELPGQVPGGLRRYSTASSAAQGILAPMTEKQIRGICDEIVKDIKGR